ncbi:MAG: AAA family ATPase [Candidatus Moeniiplasma glomeromycotorum]|nr:AAA family ATPase [Candidatus Moeniiplasma glomeromycotorum]MCE8167537.1 AAA family ATPase [Candidatus Moeniiplasma glomeromycotorum]
MYLDDFDSFTEKQSQTQQTKPKKKQSNKWQLLIFIFLAGIGYYFLAYLPRKRDKAREEISKLLQKNQVIAVSDLDNNLWKGGENWEEYLDELFLVSQINLFFREMKREIIEKSEREKEKPLKAREKAIEEIEEFAKNNWTKDELELPELQGKIKEFTKQIKKTSVDKLSKVVEEANNFIVDVKVKRQGLHWKRKIHNWADRWLLRNRNSFESAWEKMTKFYGGEPNYFDAAAIYEIKFPPSLWNNLDDKQQELAKKKGHSELKLKDEVQSYKFSPLITEWEDKSRSDPIRGELDPNDLSNLDNNALFYGAPRTGKSVMAEKLAYEADKYPLVVIQGSTLTPKKSDNDIGATLLIKFIYTISDITHKLVEDFNFEREEDGEVRYILFLDEADQICTTHLLPPKDASSQLTFLKECMGSDSKEEETKNLWIAATNHLDNVNPAVYQSGRLSNRLSFSWTIGEFIEYSKDAGINSQFPQRWIEDTTLNDEDNQWVNRFNKIIFDKDFLPFWSKFIEKNPEAEYEPEEDEKEEEQPEGDDDQEPKNKKVKIKWGEMFEFFWRLKDSSQLANFDGKFANPRDPKIEEVIKESSITAANHISKTLNTRLKDIWENIKDIKDEMTVANTTFSENMNKATEEITTLLASIGEKMK